jgi:hypothetical protein
VVHVEEVNLNRGIFYKTVFVPVNYRNVKPRWANTLPDCILNDLKENNG